MEYGNWSAIWKIKKEYCKDKNQRLVVERTLSCFFLNLINGCVDSLEDAIEDVNRRLQALNIEVDNISQLLERKPDINKLDGKVKFTDNNPFITFGDFKVKIPRSTYIKLQSMENVTSDDIIRMVLKYAPILGGCFWSIPINAYRYLEREGFTVECFASPLNHYLDRYYSMYPEVDGIFGSLGNFFDMFLDATDTKYVINPPFTSEICNKVVDMTIKKLSKPEPCTCLLYLPRWKHMKDKYETFTAFNAEYHILDKKEHYFYDYMLDSKIVASYSVILIAVSNTHEKTYLRSVIDTFSTIVHVSQRLK